MPYLQYKKLQGADIKNTNNHRSAGLTLSTQITVPQNKNQLHTTGITPMVEKNISLDTYPQVSSNGGMKRSASPKPSEAKKRSKSGEESAKAFQESSDWD